MSTGRKTVVITGAEGRIGRRLLPALAPRYKVRAVTRDPVPGLESTVADVADVAAMEAAFTGAGAVVHLAASAPVSTPWPDVLHNNIEGAYGVYEGARRAGVSQVIFASSNHAAGMWELERDPDALYRRRAGVMVDPWASVRPDSLYGVSKAFGEALGRFYSEVHGLRVYCLRIGWMLDGEGPELPAHQRPARWPLRDLPLSDDDARRRLAAFWLSHRDFARLIEACLEADHVSFGIYFAMSDNPYRFWSLENARSDLGWWPLDSASEP